MKDIVLIIIAIIGIILLTIISIAVSFAIFSGLLYLGSFTGLYEWSLGLSIGIYAILILLSLIIKGCLAFL